MELLKSHRTGHIHKEDILKALVKTKKSAHTKMVKLLDWSPTHHKIASNNFNFETDVTESRDLSESTVPPIHIYPVRKLGKLKKLANVQEEVEIRDQVAEFDPSYVESKEIVRESLRPRRSNSCPPKRNKIVSLRNLLSALITFMMM